ncbi:hypothetical protein IFM89_013616 [Coptis chinensis]|uniref:F-box associated domain-containing protein n=1 Tax=Coptis chinensis TaxID=261450 RepID=A0A835M623_9MAGN|nr:hypothetical protein IFM89_013616 [Coptis chinensis]
MSQGKKGSFPRYSGRGSYHSSAKKLKTNNKASEEFQDQEKPIELVIVDYKQKAVTTGLDIPRQIKEKPWRSLHTPPGLENNLEFKNCVGAIDLRTEKFAAFEASPWESEIQLRTLSLLGDELSAVDNRLVGHILLWVMKDYGVKESWTKKYVIRKETNEPLSYFDILRIMRSGSILFHGHRTQGYYDTIKEEFKHVAIRGIPSRTRPYSESLEGVLHVGSLISPRSLVLQQHK